MDAGRIITLHLKFKRDNIDLLKLLLDQITIRLLTYGHLLVQSSKW